MWYRCVWIIVLGMRAGLAGAEEIAWQDFERTAATALLDAKGPVQSAIDNAAPGGEGGVGGKALRAVATGRSLVLLKPDAAPLPKDLAELSEVSLWVHRPEGDEKPVLELQFREEDGKAWYWRKVVVEKPGWNRVSLPLRYFRTSAGRNPDWAKVRSMVFYFRDKGQVSIDAIRFSRKEGVTAMSTMEELTRLAFPDAPGKARMILTPRVCLISDSPDLDMKALEQHLVKLLDEVEKELPLLPRPPRPATLIVFGTDAQYRAFPARLAALMDSSAAAPTSDGYTLQGIATSAWNAHKGSLRPVYAHELVHSYLERNAALPDGGDWTHEGLASFFQLRLHPQEDFARMVRAGIADPARHTPLAELCSGKRIAGNRYWQAMTVWNFLLSTPQYREKLPQLFEHFRLSASTDLGPALKNVFNTDWEGFSNQWKDFCAKTYAD